MNIDKPRSGEREYSLCDAIVACVERLTANRLAGLGVAAGLMLTLLGAMGMALEVGADQGMGRFLEVSADHTPIARAWASHGVSWLAVAYLAIDAVVFVPIYGALMIGLSPRVGALNPHWPLQRRSCA